MAKKETGIIELNKIKETKLIVELIGEPDSDLILNKKCRSFEREQIFIQTHGDGEEVPDNISTKKRNYNLWEHLITSITWRDPIVFHDDDYSKYTEDEWRYYMEHNAPCILSNAFTGAMGEAFKTFGYKQTTGKAGTDLRRAVNFCAPRFPITFEQVGYEQKLVPNNSMDHKNVIAQYNVFHNWKCVVEIACADVVFPEKTIISLLETTGKYIGVGTQRKNGYGRWHVGEIKKIDG